MTIGKRIKRARENAMLTQKELAEKIGKGFSTVQKYELDLVSPPLETLQKIAEVLCIQSSDLLGMESTDKSGDMAALEQNLLQCGCSLGFNEEDAYLWINFPDGTLEVTEKELTELQSEMIEYLRFKLVELRKKHEADFRKASERNTPPAPYFF